MINKVFDVNSSIQWVAQLATDFVLRSWNFKKYCSSVSTKYLRNTWTSNRLPQASIWVLRPKIRLKSLLVCLRTSRQYVSTTSNNQPTWSKLVGSQVWRAARLMPAVSGLVPLHRSFIYSHAFTGTWRTFLGLIQLTAWVLGDIYACFMEGVAGKIPGEVGHGAGTGLDKPAQAPIPDLTRQVERASTTNQC